MITSRRTARIAAVVLLFILPAANVALVRIVCREYRFPGDTLSLTMDVTANRLTALDVSTHLEQPSSPVTLNGQFATLNDGTTTRRT